MNTETGNLRELNSQDIGTLLDSEVKVNSKDLTKKQKKERKVSLKDHRSKVGKQLTQARRKIKVQRNDLCPCSSGVKYKNCCLNKKK